MSSFFIQILPKLGKLYLFIILGVILGIILQSKRDKWRKIITNLMIYLISPVQIYIILTSSQIQFDISTILQIIASTFILFTFQSVSTHFYLKRKPSIEKPERVTYFLLNSFGNTMFFTVPIIITFFSEELTIVPVISSSVTLMLRGSIGVYICERAHLSADELDANLTPLSTRIKDVLKKLFSFPPFVAIIVGFISFSFHWHSNPTIQQFLVVKPIINEISSDVSLIIVGMVLSSIHIKLLGQFKLGLARVALFRFVFAFIVYLLFAFVLQFSYAEMEIKTILLIIFTAPPAIFNVLFSIFFKLDEKFAAVSVAALTLVSLILLPVWIMFGAAFF